MPISPRPRPKPPRAPAPRWERRKESRPAELIEAALELFVERGYAATRLEDIAAHAGVSKGTLYLYFASKEELFKALVRQSIVPLIETFGQGIAQSDAPSSELLRLCFFGWWSKIGATRLSGISKMIVAEARNFPDMARFFQKEVVTPGSRVLAAILERGIARGEFRPIDVEVAVNLWMAPIALKAIWSHSIAPCCAPELVIDPERFLNAHLEFVLRALAPEKALT